MKRGFLIAAVALGILLVGGAIAGWALWPDLEAEARARARDQGLDVKAARTTVTMSEVVFEDATVTLLGVEGITVEAKQIVVGMKNFEPGTVAVLDARAKLVGSPADLSVALSRWSARYRTSLGMPFVARPLAVEWRARADDAPWLTATNGRVTPFGAGAVFGADDVTVAGSRIGHFDAAWTGDAGHATLALGAKTPGAATVAMVIRGKGDASTAKLTLARTPISKLGPALATKLPVPATATVAAEVSLKALLDEAGKVAPGPLKGQATLTLDGWVPPHPPELNGIISGKTTRLATDLTLDASRTRLSLNQTKLSAGAFQLEGGGLVERHGSHATASLKLGSDLPCADLARSATQQKTREALGPWLSALAGNAARRAVAGTVKVTVEVRADSRKLADTDVVEELGIGCGLKPMASMQKELEKAGQEVAEKFGGILGDLRKKAKERRKRLEERPGEIAGPDGK